MHCCTTYVLFHIIDLGQSRRGLEIIVLVKLPLYYVLLELNQLTMIVKMNCNLLNTNIALISGCFVNYIDSLCTHYAYISKLKDLRDLWNNLSTLST